MLTGFFNDRKKTIIIVSHFLTQKKQQMKKLLFALMAISLMATASSCKKCGYCRDINGNPGSAVCKGGTFGPLEGDNYKESETNCRAQGGTWIVD